MILRIERYQYLLIICQYQATHYSQGAPCWGSSKSFLYCGSHISTISFSPKRKRNRSTFSHLWVLTTVELRCRIIFFPNSVIFAWSSFSFKFKYLQLAMTLLHAQIHLKSMLSKRIFVLALILENIFKIRKFVRKVQNYFSLPSHSHTHYTNYQELVFTVMFNHLG